jgi:hypothetical protein
MQGKERGSCRISIPNRSGFEESSSQFAPASSLEGDRFEPRSRLQKRPEHRLGIRESR